MLAHDRVKDDGSSSTSLTFGSHQTCLTGWKNSETKKELTAETVPQSKNAVALAAQEEVERKWSLY